MQCSVLCKCRRNKHATLQQCRLQRIWLIFHTCSHFICFNSSETPCPQTVNLLVSFFPLSFSVVSKTLICCVQSAHWWSFIIPRKLDFHLIWNSWKGLIFGFVTPADGPYHRSYPRWEVHICVWCECVCMKSTPDQHVKGLESKGCFSLMSQWTQWSGGSRWNKTPATQTAWLWTSKHYIAFIDIAVTGMTDFREHKQCITITWKWSFCFSRRGNICFAEPPSDFWREKASDENYSSAWMARMWYCFTLKLNLLC